METGLFCVQVLVPRGSDEALTRPEIAGFPRFGADSKGRDQRPPGRGDSGAAIVRGGAGMLQRASGTGRRFAFLVAAIALLAAGCTTDQSTFNKAVIDPAAGSEANIGSLTTVIQRNPTDANGYN